MSNLAEKLRELGVNPGDIVEVGYRADGLDADLSEAMGDEKPPAMLGEVLEVTAIGETRILAYTLHGWPGEFGGNTYADHYWERYSWGECMHAKHSMVRKVGTRLKSTNEIVWTEPDLVNIYTRLQTQGGV